jgi:hypothetical protein
MPLAQFLVLLLLVIGLSGLLIKLRTTNMPWLELSVFLLGLGGLSNLCALAANHGFMPVIDPWAHPPTAAGT